MSKKIKLALIIAFALTLIGAPSAFAGGSDSPTPYTVSAEGVTLPDGQTFQDNGHVNVKSNQGDKGIHFESLNNQPSGQWIGKSFLPWSAFGYNTDTLCVTWVQLSQYNEHFGEGGQAPIGKGCVTSTPTPSESPSQTPTPTPTPGSSSSPAPTPTPTSTTTPTSTPSPSSSATIPPTVVPSSSPSTPSSTSSGPNLDQQTLAETGNDDWFIQLLVTLGLVALTAGMVTLYVSTKERE